MKKLIGLLLTAMLSFAALSPLAAAPAPVLAAGRADVLKVCNWEDYIDEELISEFEEYYRQKTGNPDFYVEYSTFDTNETLLTKIETAKEDYDMVCPSEYAIQKLYQKGLLLPIDTSQMENYENVSPYAREQFEILTSKDQVYAIGYFWGTLGVMFNVKDVESKGVNPAEISWDVLWNSDFSNKILMKDSVRDSVVAAAIYAHKDELATITDPALYAQRLFEIINPETEEEMLAIQDALISQKTDVGVFYEVDDGKNDMVLGTYSLNLAWSGDAWWSIVEALEGEMGTVLDYAVPTEGSNVWFDGWCIPKYAKNVPAALAFMDFLNSSDAAVRNMDTTGYISVVGTYETLEYLMTVAEDSPEYGQEVDASYFFTGNGFVLPEDSDIDVSKVFLNRVMLADYSTISRCAVMNTFKDNQAAMNMWNAVKGDTLPMWAIILILGALACLIVAAFLFRYIKEKKQLARRRAVKERQMKELQKERQERQLERLRMLKEAGALQDEPHFAEENSSPQAEEASAPAEENSAPQAEENNSANE